VKQFCVYENLHEGTNELFPCFLNIQHPLHERLETRLVIPLARKRSEIKDLTFNVHIDNELLVAVVPEMFTVSMHEMGRKIDDLSDRSGEIINTIDLLITGF